MKSPFEKDFWRAENLRSTWEYKTIALIFRALVALIIILYLALTAPYIWPWAQASYARSQPIETFEQLLTQAIKNNDFSWAYRWLQARPGNEAQEHATVLERHITNIPALLLYTMPRASKQAGDIDGQRFWLTYTQYRIRFDTLRCGIPGLVDKYEQLKSFAHTLGGESDPMQEIYNDPAKMAAMLQQVLDYDAKYPAVNQPHFTCDTFAKFVTHTANIVPQESWATIRHTLRLTTEAGIYKLKNQAAAQDGELQTPTSEPTP